MKKRIRLGIERKRHFLVALRKRRKWFRKSEHYKMWEWMDASATEQIGPRRALPVSSACWVPFDFQMHQAPTP